jgi:hypothetical protein
MTLPLSPPEVAEKQSLLRRDWVLLPFISVVSMVLLMASLEWVARRMFASSKTSYVSCMTLDSATGTRGIPNSVCWEKPPEGSLIEYRFNSCGHRAGVECGPKPRGTYRIVLIGSSVALGQHVDQDKSFAALLPGQLTELTGRSVGLYNEGMGFGFSHRAALHFNEVLAAQPDLVLWVLTPLDISEGADIVPRGNPDPGVGFGFSTKWSRRLQASLASHSIEAAAATMFSYSKTSYMLQHFLYQSQSATISAYLAAPDDEAGYLKAELSAPWRNSLRQFGEDADNIERQANSAGVPFAATLVPGRAQAAMISKGEWPAGFNPYKLNDELRSVIVSHRGIYIDIVPDFRSVPNPERLYFAMDGHPNAGGSAVIASALAKELTSGAIPALRTAQMQVAVKRGD